MPSSPDCLFCNWINHGGSSLLNQNDLAAAWTDQNPVSPGHAFVTPKRHIDSFFDLTSEELAAIYELLGEVKAQLDHDHHPDGYNLGINDGEAAGRTIHHLHIHLIPRYIGDVPNPRGGVRHIIPDKGNY